MTKALLKPRFEGDKPRMVNVVIRELVLGGSGSVEKTSVEWTPEKQTKALIYAVPRAFDKQTGEENGYAEQIESVHFSWERFQRQVENRTVADEVGDLLGGC